MCLSWISSFIVYFSLLGLTDLNIFQCLGMSAVIFIVLTVLKK